jgi:hypothetical protein
MPGIQQIFVQNLFKNAILNSKTRHGVPCACGLRHTHIPLHRPHSLPTLQCPVAHVPGTPLPCPCSIPLRVPPPRLRSLRPRCLPPQRIPRDVPWPFRASLATHCSLSAPPPLLVRPPASAVCSQPGPGARVLCLCLCSTSPAPAPQVHVHHSALTLLARSLVHAPASRRCV